MDNEYCACQRGKKQWITIFNFALKIKIIVENLALKIEIIFNNEYRACQRGKKKWITISTMNTARANVAKR